MFFVPNQKIGYRVNVTDKEDGELKKGIDPSAVEVTLDFLPEGFDKNMIANNSKMPVGFHLRTIEIED